ncbi:MAG: DedA family protein [Spirochaetota bacterium]|jgi:membrane protein YqaA with SNARE-associated domain|nr:DedA family protein [Spirochaetota bacterium]
MNEKRPNIIRRLYDWVLHWADTPYGTPALAVNAFSESSFFPVPPDVLLIALDLGKPKRAWRYAFVCSVFSVLGGVLGYYIGYGLWESVGKSIVDFYNANEIFNKLAATFAAYNFWAVLIAALTPIPYKIFTISAGVAASTLFSHSQSAWAVEDALTRIFGVARIQELGGMPDFTGFFLTFLIASVLGRSIRFFAVSALIYFFGETIKTFIDRYFNWLSIAFVVLLLGGFYIISKIG